MHRLTLLSRTRPASLLLLLICALSHLPAQTTVEKSGDTWSWQVDGQPFELKGATFGYQADVDGYDRYFQDLKFLGVNSIRTWGTDESTGQLLDAAHRHGLKVMLGIWMRHGRPGMEADDRFDYLTDEVGKQALYDQALATVQAHKDHPALLLWGVGNEVYLNTATDEEKEAYSLLLERICQDIKERDPHHPIASVCAWTLGVAWWSRYVPSLDIYGINVYGAGAQAIPAELAKLGVDKPYLITEFGVRGEWDIDPDRNGVIPEPSDQEKYAAIVQGYHHWIKPPPNCLGAYVFHYADDARFIGPWLLTHFRGLTRPQYWAIREAYTGQPPLNQVPVIDTFGLPERAVKGGEWIPVTLQVSDPEGEALDVTFCYNQRSGSRKRRDQLTPLKVRGSLAEGFAVQVPPEHGGLKVYAVVRDAYHNAGIATTSISAVDPEAQARRFLVPRVALPFYVYQDDGELPYIPSGHMGNYKAMTVDLNHTEGVHAGTSCIRIRYADTDGWYGLALVDPPGDWGEILGGYDLGEAKTLRFWARASYDAITVQAGFGLIEDDKPFPDTGKRMAEFVLSDQWQRYEIKVKKADLSCIRSGFVIFGTGIGLAHEIFLDDIVFE